MAHWHDNNPWSAHLVYISEPGELEALTEGRYSLDELQKQGHPKLDIYLIPNFSFYHSLGIRYGREPNEYYSPWANQEIAERLLWKYAPQLFNIEELHKTINRRLR